MALARHRHQIRLPRFVHHLAIELGETQSVIGWTALTTLAPSTREWALSFALAKAHWCHGYMTEAVAALVDHAFLELNAHRIFVEVDPANAASTRVVERCAFELEGRLCAKNHFRGEWCDALLYAILEERS